MKKSALIVMAFVALAPLVGCAAYPTSSTVQGTADGSIWFSNAPVGATVRIDGVEAGSAAAFDGAKAVMSVEPGRHLIEVMNAGEVVLRQAVVVASGSRFEVRVR